MRLLTIISILLSTLLTSRAATVVIKGLSGELQERMVGQMRPRLEFITERAATEWRADDATFFLQELLIKRGYADSKVNWKLPGNNIIQLNVNLGTKYVIGRVYSTSRNAMKAELLDDYFCQPVIQRELSRREDSPYLEGYPAEGAANIANYLKSQGYWKASVSVASVIKRRNGKVDIRLNMRKGPMFYILPPRFSGVSPQHRALLAQKYTPFIGKEANTVNITELNNTVFQFYRDQGFEFAKIEISSNQKSGRKPGIEIHFDINSGKRYIVRNVSITGNKRTKTRRFNRYVKDLERARYDKKTVDAVTKKLLLTGAFESVRIIPKRLDGNGNQIDLELQVTEAKPRFIRAYAGAASFDGFILGSSYTNQNFLNKLQTFSTKAEINNRGVLGEVSLTEPYFAGVPISQTTRLYALQRRFEGYKKAQTGIEASFTWKPRKEYTTKLFIGLDYVSVDSDFLTPAELGPTNYLNAKLSLEQSFDFRDNNVLPTKGFHGRGLLEYGTISGDASNAYFRTDINTSYRYALKNEDRVEVRFNAGAIFPNDRNDLPIDLRLFSGGADSVRGFGERELGPRSISGDPLGGQAYWNASVEYVKPFNDLISAVVFYDVGTVFPEASDFSFSNPSQSAGLGIRFDLPVGPARFEYGFNLNQKPGEPSGAFHFSIGAKF